MSKDIGSADDEQEKQWKEHAEKSRAKGLCEYSGIEMNQCYRFICDCFDSYCKTCLEQKEH